MAAENHERAATFWNDHGDLERAALQREMAEHERGGAALERRWAELLDPSSVQSTRRASEFVVRHTRRGAKRLSAILIRTAEALEKTADLAEEHAQRRERTGRTADAAEERRAAERSREAAQRARSHAEEWLTVSDGRNA